MAGQIEYGLVVAQVNKSFGNHRVLNDANLTVSKGEFFTLLGPSGCGKTTLLRLIAGLELPDSGVIYLNGEDITNVPANKRFVNTVFQSYALFPHLTVFENVAFGLKARKVDPSEVRLKVNRMLETLDLDELGKRFPNQLSGGQRQRVALARALVNEPSVLLLDEPMSALDPYLRAQVQSELIELHHRVETTFIMVTHDQAEAMSMGGYLAVMKDGRIVQSGTPRDVYSHPKNKFVAEFLWGANILQATRDGDFMITTLGPLKTANQVSWSEGHLAIRPELISLDYNQAGANYNLVKATVLKSVYRGPSVELLLDPGPVKVVTSPRYNHQPGDTVSLFISPDDLVVLDNQAA
ncbi:MAG: ABC transporter ATP-binding protein [Deltaproteobacteria bacterium]|nr:ABC transporter ATP-binding protein [Deltaproteobacteria bacterium]